MKKFKPLKLEDLEWEIIVNNHFKDVKEKLSDINILQIACKHTTSEVHIEDSNDIKLTNLVCSKCGKILQLDYKLNTE